MNPSNQNLVPLSQPIGSGTAGQTMTAWDKLRDRNGTSRLKTLANRVLRTHTKRDNEWDKAGTKGKNLVPPSELQRDKQSLFEERAALIEYEAGLPREWAEAFAWMDLANRPEPIPKKAWAKIKDNTGRLFDHHVHDLIRHGWAVKEIFGCHFMVPQHRYDYMGLLLILGDAEVVEVTLDCITLRTRTGAIQGYTRKPVYSETERKMIWELG